MTATGLSGRVVVVTGCAQGIGLALCLEAAALGMKVAGLDVNVEGGEAMARAAAESGAEAVFVRCDVSDPDEIEAAFATIERELGAVSALVNNAAYIRHAAPEDLSFADWQRMVGVNITGQVFVAQHAGRSMMAAGNGGAIVNMTSIAGLAALGRGNYAYSVAKSAIVGITRELAVEWATSGIRVNAVAPSQVYTEGFRKLVGDERIVGGNIVSTAVRGIPLGRLAEPSDIVAAILFLLSDDAAFITGVVLPVDGGSMALHSGGSIRALNEEN